MTTKCETATRFMPTDDGTLLHRVDGWLASECDFVGDTIVPVPAAAAALFRSNLPSLPLSIVARFHSSDSLLDDIRTRCEVWAHMVRRMAAI